MTIPEYDIECDCDFCTEERAKRLKAYQEKYEKGQQAIEQEFNPDDYVEENPYKNPNGHPDKLRQQAGEP
jgi:hypothetical protein